MDYWKVLPTNPDFKNLTQDMINLMLFGLEEKNRKEAVQNAIANGNNVGSSSFNDDDLDWMYSRDFDPLGGADIDEVNRQIKAMAKDVPEQEHETVDKDQQKELAKKALSNTLKALGGEHDGE